MSRQRVKNIRNLYAFLNYVKLYIQCEEIPYELIVKSIHAKQRFMNIALLTGEYINAKASDVLINALIMGILNNVKEQ